ncbi:MAG TPA: 2,3-bisphosphoglycerate-independent phosphoglycerate mutase [Patescibacteria group bacterium]|nr:2,3-bisphosphoglycerate-independent phosphoglycerate mutase [Patescibacteria group bacterium]
MTVNSKNLPLVLIILDGWGIAPPSRGNAITNARTPNMDSLIKSYPSVTLQASGPSVGLRFGEMGNSEVGHSNIGTGRVVHQNLPRISHAISDGSFFTNTALLSAMNYCKTKKQRWLFHRKPPLLSRLHLMGILSDSGVHGHIEHLFALLIMAKELGIQDVAIHVFLDGRDAIYNSGLGYIKKLQKQIQAIGVGKIATVAGRFYGMDRDNHWDRIEESYRALVHGKAKKYHSDPVSAVQESYEHEIFDEEMVPIVIRDDTNKPVGLIRDGDSVIFFNYRADRARELTKALVLPEFTKFKRKEYFPNLHFVTMTEYESHLPVLAAFPQERFDKTLGEVIANAGLRQLRMAETEKYVHVTFFFNGLSDAKYSGEDHLVVPSPNVSSYRERPEMAARELTSVAMKQILSGKYDVVVLNFANADMVSHTGDPSATLTAIETVDKCLGELVEVTMSKDGIVVITADHGNAEELVNLQTGEIDKEHSNNPVPFIIVGKKYEGKSLVNLDTVGADLSLISPHGVLSDVAPTILKILEIEQPPEMTGTSLL